MYMYMSNSCILYECFNIDCRLACLEISPNSNTCEISSQYMYMYINCSIRDTCMCTCISIVASGVCVIMYLSSQSVIVYTHVHVHGSLGQLLKCPD